MESHKFNKVVQKEHQPFSEFETDLREQMQLCEYKCECGKSYEDRTLRDRIIVGVYDKKLQLKLLDARDELLPRVVSTCKAYEAANANKGMLDAKQAVVNILTINTNEMVETAAVSAINRFCYNCGGPWKFGHKNECKARDIICHMCRKKEHFQKFC